MDMLAQMATYVRVVDGKSLSAAARSLRRSLPAVSRQLRALEDELGTSLVARSTRQLRVTDAGREWYEHCVRVLGEMEEAKAALRSDSVRGTLVVSASLTFGSIVVAPRLPALTERHPQLGVEMRLQDQLVDLIGEGVDVALRAGSPPPDSTALVAHPIMEMARCLVAAPRWLRRHGTPKSPEQLTQHDCLLQVTPGGAEVRWHLRRAHEERVVPVRGRLRTNAPLTLRDLAVQGSGIAYLPSWLVADDVAAGRLRRVLPAWSAPPLMAWAIHRAELRGAPRIRAFLDAMPRP